MVEWLVEMQRMAREFELVGGHPALDFVNTLDWRFRPAGPEELLNSYSDVVRFVAQSKLLSRTQARKLLEGTSGTAAATALQSCTELREALADTLYPAIQGQRPSLSSIKTLERHFQAAQMHKCLSWSNSELRWDWAGTGPECEPDLPLWMLASTAADLLTSDGIQRVRSCDNPDCLWLFLDTSKNHTRRWCDMKLCGNRMKARRFKAQRAN